MDQSDIQERFFDENEVFYDISIRNKMVLESNEEEPQAINSSEDQEEQEKYEEATQYLNEAMRVNKENLKTLYRMAFCHFKLEKFKDAKEDINNDLNKINKKGGDKNAFDQLLFDINQKIKELENEQDNLLKKMVKNKAN